MELYVLFGVSEKQGGVEHECDREHGDGRMGSIWNRVATSDLWAIDMIEYHLDNFI